MPVSDQGLTSPRYSVIPRTAIVLRRGDASLLLKGSMTRRAWPGKYNCVGGHIEKNEAALSAARRELLEETGLEADIWLCGVVMVDAGEVGVCLFVFSGQGNNDPPRASREGAAEWISDQRLGELPVVEDVPVLLARIRQMKPTDSPFFARSHYDENGRISIEFDG